MPNPRQEAIVRATVLLASIKKNTANVSSVPETRVREYHAVLDKIKSETGIDVVPFRVPESDLAPVLLSFDTFKKEKKFSKEKHVSSDLFLAKLNSTLKVLDSNLGKAGA